MLIRCWSIGYNVQVQRLQQTVHDRSGSGTLSGRAPRPQGRIDTYRAPRLVPVVGASWYVVEYVGICVAVFSKSSVP